MTNQYEVFIDRKSSIKLRLLENGEDISSHTATNTYKTLQDIIGIDFKTFTQLVYQNTNSSLQFLTATDTNRKKFLIDLLHLEHYVKLFELFKEESRKQSLNLTSIESKIATIEKWLQDNKLSDTVPYCHFKKFQSTRKMTKKNWLILRRNCKIFRRKIKKLSQNNTYKDLLMKIDIQAAQNCTVTEKVIL